MPRLAQSSNKEDGGADIAHLRRTKVSLGLYGANLIPEDITEALGVTPTYSHRAGDQKVFAGVDRGDWTSGTWLLEMEVEAPDGPEQAVGALLDLLPDACEVWEPLMASYDARILVGLFTGGVNCGFALSSPMLSRVSRLGLRLEFDIYVP